VGGGGGVVIERERWNLSEKGAGHKKKVEKNSSGEKIAVTKKSWDTEWEQPHQARTLPSFK